MVVQHLGGVDPEIPGDVNGDGVVNIVNIVLVASVLTGAAAALSAQILTTTELITDQVQEWLIAAQRLHSPQATIA